MAVQIRAPAQVRSGATWPRTDGRHQTASGSVGVRGSSPLGSTQDRVRWTPWLGSVFSQPGRFSSNRVRPSASTRALTRRGRPGSARGQGRWSSATVRWSVTFQWVAARFGTATGCYIVGRS